MFSCFVPSSSSGVGLCKNPGDADRKQNTEENGIPKIKKVFLFVYIVEFGEEAYDMTTQCEA